MDNLARALTQCALSLHVHPEGSMRLQSKAAPISETLARVASSQSAPATPASKTVLGETPKEEAASQLRVRSVSRKTGSSDEIEHRIPALTRSNL